jgi:hypothetical protein
MDNIRNEKVEDSKVESYLTNGIEILERNSWKGRYIPFVSCYGKVLYVDEGAGPKRRLLSMTRLARDPYLLYCYYRTTEAELVGATPRFPYFAYEGQLSPSQLKLLQKANHEPVAVIQIKATVDGAPANSLLPHPQRNPYDPPIEKFEIGAEAARRAIQAAMGISPLPTDAQRHSQKSGVALRQIESSGQKGSFHFVDHYELMIERTGVIIEDEKARITASKQSADLAAEAAEERIALGRQQLHEAAENARDRAHDVHMGIVDHQQAMQQADQAHGNALEQGVQAAALAPQPAEEGAEA